MSKALITMETLTIAQNTTFKDPRLAAATSKIVKLYSDTAAYVEKKNREFAEILSTVKKEKSYEKDGFKSVAEYAEKTFGISRSNAYALAAAGDFYTDKSTPEEVKAFTPSKLAELANVPKKTIAAAIKSGEISTTTSQKDLRDFAKANSGKESTEAKVLPQYTARLVSTATPDTLAKVLDSVHILEDWEAVIIDYMTATYTPRRTPEVIKLSKCAPEHSPTQDKKPIPRLLFITENASLAFEFYEKTPEKVKDGAKKAPTYTIEQLEAMLAEAKKAKEEN